MKLANPLIIGWESAKANVVPTFVLWSFAAGLVLAYYWISGVAEFLAPVRSWQDSFGWKAVVVSRIFFNGIIPGIFLVSVKAIRPHHPLATIFALTAFGCVFGIVGDAFFRLQCDWFGSTISFLTLTYKTSVDQFVFTVLVIAPANALFFFWLGRDFSFRRVTRDWPGRLWMEELLLPNLIANWFVFIPVAFATYVFPVDLQIHVNGLTSAFWMLMCLQIGKRSAQTPTARPSL